MQIAQCRAKVPLILQHVMLITQWSFDTLRTPHHCLTFRRSYAKVIICRVIAMNIALTLGYKLASFYHLLIICIIPITRPTLLICCPEGNLCAVTVSRLPQNPLVIIVISKILCLALCHIECRKYLPPCLQDGCSILCDIMWPCEEGNLQGRLCSK